MSDAPNPKGNPNWKPGVSGNPGGRPKKLTELQTTIQGLTGDLVGRLQEIAFKGDERNAVPAIKLLLAYGYGAPTQTQTIQGPNGENVGVIVLPAEKK